MDIVYCFGFYFQYQTFMVSNTHFFWYRVDADVGALNLGPRGIYNKSLFSKVKFPKMSLILRTSLILRGGVG